MQNYLRLRSNAVDQKSLVAQRIKRLSSIESKLGRFQSLKLSQMQDIGGCRSVVRDARHVDQLVDAYHRSRIKHKLIGEKDYITAPKACGYRSRHLVYGYFSDKTDRYNDLRIEIQIRSSLQHAWATAVETVDTFTQQALKSNQGGQDWQRFFALMSTVLALREDKPIVPGTPSDSGKLTRELKHYSSQLDIFSRIETYRKAATLKYSDPKLPNARYYLIRLDLEQHQVKVERFGTADLEAASAKYLKAEQELGDPLSADVVLVSVESVWSLRRAYPNYFLDTSRFLKELQNALGGN